MTDLVLGDVDLVIAREFRLDVVDPGLQGILQSTVVCFNSEDVLIFSRKGGLNHHVRSALEHH